MILFLTWFLLTFLGLFIFGQLWAYKYIHRFKFIRVRDYTLHYQENGSSHLPPLILIHGMFSNQECWDKVRTGLSDQYHVFSLDLPGMGESVTSGTIPYENIEELIYEFCQALRLDSPIIMGCSLGGVISGLTFQKYPDYFNRCFVVSSPMSPGILILPFYKLTFLAYLGNWFVNPLIVFWTHFLTARKNFTIDQSLSILCKFRHFSHFRASLAYTGVLKRIVSLRKNWPKPWSTCFLWGTSDHLVKKGHFETFLKENPQILYIELNGAAHHPMESHPEEFLSIFFNIMGASEKP